MNHDLCMRSALLGKRLWYDISTPSPRLLSTRRFGAALQLHFFRDSFAPSGFDIFRHSQGRVRLWRAWASDCSTNTPLLSDDAVGRENILASTSLVSRERDGGVKRPDQSVTFPNERDEPLKVLASENRQIIEVEINRQTRPPFFED